MDEDFKQEMIRDEAFEVYNDALLSEFEQSVSRDDILRRMFEEMTKEEIITHIMEDPENLYEGDDYEDTKQWMFGEYKDNR